MPRGGNEKHDVQLNGLPVVRGLRFDEAKVFIRGDGLPWGGGGV